MMESRRGQKGRLKLNVLVACEESQRVCIAFREQGHNAFSCDIQECSGHRPEWHIQGDCLGLIDGNVSFVTQNGQYQYIKTWDLIIAHPPCTRLCSSGQRWLYYGNEEYRQQKRVEQEQAIEFFLAITNAKCERIAIENPVGIMSRIYRKPDQIYNPFNFAGETEAKRTCLWLKGLKPLQFTQTLSEDLITHDIYKAHFGKQYAWNDPEVAKLRSKTPWGVARAMAAQWGINRVNRG